MNDELKVEITVSVMNMIATHNGGYVTLYQDIYEYLNRMKQEHKATYIARYLNKLLGIVLEFKENPHLMQKGIIRNLIK